MRSGEIRRVIQGKTCPKIRKVVRFLLASPRNPKTRRGRKAVVGWPAVFQHHPVRSRSGSPLGTYPFQRLRRLTTRLALCGDNALTVSCLAPLKLRLSGLRLQPELYCFWPGGIAAGSRSDCVSVSGIAPLSSEATQSPAHSFVPLTVPTNLHPVGPFCLTCTCGLLPTLGGALCANAATEKLIAARISKTLTVISPSPSPDAIWPAQPLASERDGKPQIWYGATGSRSPQHSFPKILKPEEVRLLYASNRGWRPMVSFALRLRP